MNIKPHLKHVQDINVDNDNCYKYRYLSMKPERTKNLHATTKSNMMMTMINLHNEQQTTLETCSGYKHKKMKNVCKNMHLSLKPEHTKNLHPSLAAQ